MQPIINSWKTILRPFAEKVGSTKKIQEQKFCFHGCVACGPGKIRTQNQDDYYLAGHCRKGSASDCKTKAKPRLLAAVADGMGGEAHGDQASLAAVRCIAKNKPASLEALEKTVMDANVKVCELMDAYRQRIGSTLTMLYLQGETAEMVNIGDSRCYFLQDGALQQLSTDHTQIRHMIEMGLMTKEQGRTHKDRHKLSQHLGIYPDEMLIEPAKMQLQVQAGNVFLLCSDGLTDMVEDSEIEKTLREDLPLHERCRSLFDQAMENGGRDNITVLLVEVCDRKAPRKQRGTEK